MQHEGMKGEEDEKGEAVLRWKGKTEEFPKLKHHTQSCELDGFDVYSMTVS